MKRVLEFPKDSEQGPSPKALNDEVVSCYRFS